MDRPNHPDKDIEKFLREAERHGWRFSKGKKYFIGKCACGSHMKTVHLTPSAARYLTNLRHKIAQLCWPEREEHR